MQPYDHTSIWAFIILILICMLCLIVLTIYIVHSNNKHRKRMEEITLHGIHISANIDQSIPGILDAIIQDCFNDYKVKMLIPLDEGVINSSREAEIRTALVSMVTTRMSPAALDKISLFYKLENIGAILGDKIYITVMNYVIDHNASVTSKKV